METTTGQHFAAETSLSNNTDDVSIDQEVECMVKRALFGGFYLVWLPC
jgi:hypothetical protein